LACRRWAFFKKESTSFCEQKEAKKLYLFLARGCSNTAQSGAKKFFGSFFQKRTSFFKSELVFHFFDYQDCAFDMLARKAAAE